MVSTKLMLRRLALTMLGKNYHTFSKATESMLRLSWLYAYMIVYSSPGG